MAHFLSTEEKSTWDRKLELNNQEVKFEFISYGVLPWLVRKEVKNGVGRLVERKVLSLDPVEMRRVAEEVEKEGFGSVWEKNEAERGKRRERVINNLAEHVTSKVREMAKEENKRIGIHTLDSLYEACESFLVKMREDPGSGVPVGFKCTVLTSEEISQITKST